MNDINLATCHCIISHPSKPKFMVIKHSSGWLPPIVKFPAEGFAGTRAQMIADGVMNKYGLKTTVLRHLLESANYHCIELEQHSRQSAKKLEAVWVGSKEYKQFRSSKPGQADPFAQWLAEAGRRRSSNQRPPWERRGWFRKAANWIGHELEKRNIQAIGSVQQHIACWHSSAVLRVQSSQGVHYFKASWNAPPNEAALTVAIAKRWPELVPGPIASDMEKNWMLMQDLQQVGSARLQDDDYPELAAALAELQIGSSRVPDEWIKLGCHSGGRESLAEFLGTINQLTAVLRMDEGGLSDDELLGLNPLVKEFRAACEQLAEYDIPETLVHPNFRAPNLVRRDGGFWIADWSGAQVSHPFFSVHEIIRSLVPQGGGPSGSARDEDDVRAAGRLRDAYLAPFEEFEAADRLQAAFTLTAALFDAWKLQSWSRRLAYIEPDSVAFSAVARGMQRICRNMLENASQDKQAAAIQAP